MLEAFFEIPNIDFYLVIGILFCFCVLESLYGFLHRTQRNSGDWIQEFGGYVILGLFIKPLIVTVVYYLGYYLFPNSSTFLSGFSFLILLIIYLLIDDILQYTYHRAAHEYPFLWKLHRPHHQAEEMGFFVSYRNALLYYFLMPNIWWVGIFTFIGGGKAVALGLVLKQIIIVSSHSTVKYDEVFYRNKFLKPLIMVWERIFITPVFHHAHHGKTRRDGISNPNGNFGNMFSIWDQLFGTAVFNREFPIDYGLENDPKEHWTESYFHPFIKSKNPNSELSIGYQKNKTSHLEPGMYHLEKGKKYLWCSCGLSKNQPFCDSSHHGTKKLPVLFEGKKDGKVRLCNCKLTKTPPYCDDSHLNKS